MRGVVREGERETGTSVSRVSCLVHLNCGLQVKDPASPLLAALNRNYTFLNINGIWLIKGYWHVSIARLQRIDGFAIKPYCCGWLINLLSLLITWSMRALFRQTWGATTTKDTEELQVTPRSWPGSHREQEVKLGNNGYSMYICIWSFATASFQWYITAFSKLE